MSAVFDHAIGPTTVEDWLTQEHPSDGSRLELIYGYLHVNPPPTGQHQHAGHELCAAFKKSFRQAGRSDLYAVPGVGVEISSAWRTALIPDVVVLNTKPIGASFHPHELELVAEVWSPGNTPKERETKMAAYAAAGVRFFWAVNKDRMSAVSVTTYRLDGGKYIEDVTAGPGAPVTFTAAPVPVAFDPADLSP